MTKFVFKQPYIFDFLTTYIIVVRFLHINIELIFLKYKIMFLTDKQLFFFIKMYSIEYALIIILEVKLKRN